MFNFYKYLLRQGNRGSSDGITTGLWAGRPRIREARNFCRLHNVHIISGAHLTSYKMGTVGWCVKLTTIKSGGAVPPLPNTSSWHGKDKAHPVTSRESP
jgi:hypothetical protein